MRTTLSRRSALAVIASALLVTACTRTDAAAEPVWGKEPCAHCRMLVSDKRYAAQVVDEAGDHRFFDDIGCMVLWMDGHKHERAWVRAESGAWLDARPAHYVQGARTPMDFGFEVSSGDGVSFEAVREAVRAKKRTSR